MTFFFPYSANDLHSDDWIDMKMNKDNRRGHINQNPDYDAEQIMQEYLSAVSDAYLAGSAVEREEMSSVSLRQVADEFGITLLKTRKLLITVGAYHTGISDKVNALQAQGKSVEQIMELTGLGRSSVHLYLPYSRSVYNLKELSLCAKRCRLYRQRKKAVETLTMCKESPFLEEKLWEAIQIFAGYRFSTVKGLRFSYTVSGNEIVVDRKRKTIVRSSVNVALQKCRDSKWNLSGPKAMNVYGASYLYPVFLRFGLVRAVYSETPKKIHHVR